MLGGFFVAVGVVEGKIVVLDVFSDAINFYFWLMDLNLRVKD